MQQETKEYPEGFACSTLFAHVPKLEIIDYAGPLPPVWQRLKADGFHPDLVLRAERFSAYMHREGHGAVGEKVLSLMGEGFKNPFDPELILIDEDDPYAELKNKIKNSFITLASTFGNRVSSVVWYALADLATRDDPTKDGSVFDHMDQFRYPWWIMDAILHGLGHVYGLSLHVQSEVNQATGRYIEHNCDCNHAVAAMPGITLIRANLPKERFKEATAALFTHVLNQTYVIGVLGLPTVLGVSPESEGLKRFIATLKKAA